jgi:hypothetical protein
VQFGKEGGAAFAGLGALAAGRQHAARMIDAPQVDNGAPPAVFAMPSLEATIRVTPDAAISSLVDDPLAATAIAKGA